MEIHSFRVDIATKYGIAEAILLGYFYHWITVHEKNETNFYDGRYWTYDTVRGLANKHPYFSSPKIHRTIHHLIDEGLILTGNYNKFAYDKTTWYTLSETAIKLFQNETRLFQNETTIPKYNEEKNKKLFQNETGLFQNETTIPIQPNYSLDDEDDDYIKQTDKDKKVNKKVKVPGNKYPDEIYQKACFIYEKFLMPIANLVIKDSILGCVDDYGLEIFEQAVKIAAKNNARSFGYIDVVAENLAKYGGEKDGKRKESSKRNNTGTDVKRGNRKSKGQTSQRLGPYI